METAKVDKELRDITHELRDMTEKMKNLTEDTVDDSATVRIITYVSAFYLPGSFVAVSFVKTTRPANVDEPLVTLWNELLRL